MKNIMTVLAVSAFGVTAFAQQASVQPVESALAVSAKFGFESRYIEDGKRHVNENTQTNITLKYFTGASFSSDVELTPYVNFFWMSPTDNERLGQPVSDEGKLTIGSEFAVGEELTLDVGYEFTGWNDRQSAGVMNRAYVNRTNEIYFGLSKALALFGDSEDGMVKGSAYVRYDWNLEQISYELSLEKNFELDDSWNLRVAAMYGYIDSNKATGDQRAVGMPKKGNDYGYFAASADLSYQINTGTDVGIGARYAYNNDGDNDPWLNDDNNSSNLWWGAWINFRY